MKRTSLLVIALLLMLTACAPEGWTYNPASFTPSLSASAKPSLTPTELVPQPTPEPSFVPDTNIPEIVTGGESAADSSRTVYEDDSNIYILDFDEYSYTLVLYKIDKQNNSIKFISQDCVCFTVIDNKIYFIEYDKTRGFNNTIKCYDPAADEVKQIIKLTYDIRGIAAYNNKVYFSYCTEYHEDWDFNPSDLYSMKPDGKDMKRVKEDVDTFSIYRDVIYYYPSSYPDGAPLYRCGLDGRGAKELFPGLIDSDFWISGVNLYCINKTREKVINVINLDTNEVSDILKGYYVIVTLGQYLIYIPDNDEISYLHAYNSDNGKKYDLLELGWKQYRLHSSEDGAYISWNDGVNLHIAQVIINGGKASLKEQAYSVPELTPLPPEYKQPSSDTVVFATGYGYICGGYSDGKWLSHSEAALYCDGSLTFDKYNLVSRVDKVKSSGVKYEENYGGYSYSCTSDMPPETYDWSGDYYLNIPENETDYDYSKDPLCYSYLYYGVTPPKIEAVKDTSKIQPVIQRIVDKHLGKGNVKAKVRAAVKADIDGDGKKETVVNADNNAKEFESSLGEMFGEEAVNKHWFCLCCIIESDGSVVMIDEFYTKPYKEGDEYPDMIFMYVQNIIDIDGDGVCEIVLDWSAWETFFTVVSKYDGKELTDTILFGYGS